MQAVSINCIISDVLTYRLVDGEELPVGDSILRVLFTSGTQKCGAPKSGAFLLYTEARSQCQPRNLMLPSWMEMLGILLGNVVKKTKVWIASASYWKRRSPHQIAFLPCESPASTSMGFGCKLNLAGRSSWGDLHGRLCISGLISWGWSIVVMMRQIWFDYIWLLNWSYWILWPWGLGVKELEEGQKTVYWTIIIIVYVLNECFLFRIPCAYCNRCHCQPWVW